MKDVQRIFIAKKINKLEKITEEISKLAKYFEREDVTPDEDESMNLDMVLEDMKEEIERILKTL